MIYVIEISGPTGGRATKEYTSFSMWEALQQARHDLQGYPECDIIDIAPKDRREEPEDIHEW
jgi:hypothetical protein